MKILLVSDDPWLIDATNFALARHGHEVATSSTNDALRNWESHRADLVLLDLPDPLADIRICRALRRQTDVPIVILSEHGEEPYIIHAYECGADDYIIKPFSQQHLLVRLDAVGRRATRKTEAVPTASGQLVLGDLVIDAPGFWARKNGIPLPLTPLEFRILHYLALHRGVLVRAQRLAEYAWPSNPDGDMSLLKTHISHIRHKLAEAGGTPIVLRAVPRTGYILLSPSDEPAAVGSSDEPDNRDALLDNAPLA